MLHSKDTMSTDDPSVRLKGARRYVFLIAKAVEYCARYAGDPRYLFLYLTNVLKNGYKEEVQFLDEEKFLTVAKQRSTIRFGDGEFGMLLSGKGIHFQKADPGLTSRLFNVLGSYEKNSPYLLGVNAQIAIENQILERYGMKYLFMPQKLGFRLYANKQANYFNASYFYIDGKARTFIKEVTRGRHPIIVTNATNSERIKAIHDKLFPESQSASYVTTPKENAFAEYDRVLKEIIGVVDTKMSVVLLGCGPAGKVLVYDLAQKGILAHDMGHGLTFAAEHESHEHLIKWPELKDHYHSATKSSIR